MDEKKHLKRRFSLNLKEERNVCNKGLVFFVKLKLNVKLL